MSKSRLEDLYTSEIKSRLKEKLNLGNVMQVPKLSKIVLNIGVKEAVADSKMLKIAVDGLKKVSGQNPVKTKAKKSIAGFKIREGMPIGTMVTLRHKKMYDFLDKLISLALPVVRDFRGVSDKFDRNGNYNLGVKEWTIFPELDLDSFKRVYGMNISIHTTAETGEQCYELLKEFGMPFKKKDRI
jgi:large subunit ribosomal protein L5